MKWLSKNKQWIFSGIGCLVITIASTIIFNYLGKNDQTISSVNNPDKNNTINPSKEAINKTQTIIEHGMMNIEVKGTVTECENGTAKIRYFGTAIVDSPNKPVKYKDRVVAASGIIYQKFTPEAEILNEDEFKRNPTYLEYEITGSGTDKLSFKGEIVVNQRLAKKRGGLGLHIPYFAKHVIVQIDIKEASFIQHYNAMAKLINKNEIKIIKKTFNALSKTYILELHDAPADSNIAFEWENDEVQ